MLANKNIVVAFLLAPVLSVVAWWAVGVFTGENPRPAQQGQSYPLLEKSNCRYASGSCDLENTDFNLALTYVEDAAGPYLAVRSSHPLAGILMTVGHSEAELPRGSMSVVGGDNRQWRMALPGRPDPQARIRLVASVSGSTWFGDASTGFLQLPQ